MGRAGGGSGGDGAPDGLGEGNNLQTGCGGVGSDLDMHDNAVPNDDQAADQPEALRHPLRQVGGRRLSFRAEIRQAVIAQVDLPDRAVAPDLFGFRREFGRAKSFGGGHTTAAQPVGARQGGSIIDRAEAAESSHRSISHRQASKGVK